MQKPEVTTSQSKKPLGQIVAVMPEAIGIYKIPINEHKLFKNSLINIDQKAEGQLRRNDLLQKERLRHICNQRQQNIFKDFIELEQLEEKLKEYSLNYFSSTGFDCNEVIITDAWLNIGSKNAILPTHLHSNAFLSGTYFVNFNPKIHSILNFYNDRLMNGTERKPFLSIPSTTQRTVFNSKEIGLAINEGDVLYWRSHLLHGFSKPNQADGRITLSFNLMPKICHGDQYSFVVSNDY